jgi:methionyl aminopeptidase
MEQQGGDPRRITIYRPEDFEGMRRAGRLAAETLDMIAPHVRPGVTTGELDRLCHDFMVANGAVPATLGYRGYTKSSCTSVNHVVCHGIPGDRVLVEGDILNIDVTVILDGWFGDTSRMFVAGAAPTRARLLLDVTYEALMRGVAAAKPGATLGDIGHAVQSVVERNRFSVVRDFCGHGIGRRFHEPPNVLHFGRPGEGPVLRPGMFFTDRTDGERRAGGREDPGGWLDGGDARPQPFRAVRAHGRHHRNRGGGVHHLASRAAPPPYRV